MPEETTEPPIVLEDVSYTYGKGALRSAQEGSVRVLGQELKAAKRRTQMKVRRQIGFIFQSHNLLDSLTISQNVKMALQLTKVGRGEGTSRMLNLLEKHDPNSASYLATFAFALARVAYADNEVTEDEQDAMRRILKESANLKDSEVDFIMEMSMMQRRAQAEISSPMVNESFQGARKQLLVNSLYAIAEAD